MNLILVVLDKRKESPLKALTLAIQWLYARNLQGDKMVAKINKWCRQHGNPTREKVINFVKDHEMDAYIVAPLAIPALKANLP